MEIARFEVEKRLQYALRRLQTGRNIAFWRQHRGIKQWELGLALGRSQSLISRLEHGEVHVTYERLSHIATYLGVPLAYLVWELWPPPIEPDV